MQKASTDPKPPFDRNGDIFRWGPVPGKFYYLSNFCEVHYTHFRKRFGNNWSETLYLFRDGRMFWINDLRAIEKAGEEVFLEYMLPEQVRREIYAEWQEDSKKLTGLEKKIDAADIERISNDELAKIWDDFNKLYNAFLVTGSVPELANYGSVQCLQKEVGKYVSNQKAQEDALEILTAPERLSFYQEEEVELVQAKDIYKHRQKYFWLKNSYAGTQILSDDFFAKRKETIDAKIKEHLASKLVEVPKKKKELQARYKLPAEIMRVADAISEGVVWQDERKEFILIVLHYQDIFLREVARRFEYPFEDVQLLGHNEVADIIAGQDLRSKIAERKKGFGLQFFHTHRELSPEEISYFWSTYESKKVDGQVAEVRGIVASKGSGEKVVGRVHILLDPNEVENFVQGEILLAPMTSPEYVFAMKKSAAIVTDEGGLTSHAAIVSRELGIPCLVGTRVATHVFKTGDLLEVDVGSGTAKLVESS